MKGLSTYFSVKHERLFEALDLFLCVCMPWKGFQGFLAKVITRLRIPYRIGE